MLMMGFLLGSVQNKHVPLHLENIILDRESLKNHNASFIIVLYVVIYLTFIKKFSSCDSDIAFATPYCDLDNIQINYSTLI